MKNSKYISTPHNDFFLAMMKYQEFSIAFFKQHLPQKLMQALDTKSLKLLDTTYLDDSLKKSISDLVFSCKIKGKLSYITLLVEHQSTADKLMPFRIFHYLFGFLNNHRKEHPKQPLPPVYTLLFYHGEVTPYPYSLDLLKCFDDPLKIMDDVLCTGDTTPIAFGGQRQGQ